MPVGTAHGHKDAIAAVAKNVIRNVMYKDVQFALPISFIVLTACNFSQRVDEKERNSIFFGTKGASDDAGLVMCVASRSGDAGHDHGRRLQKKADLDLVQCGFAEVGRVTLIVEELWYTPLAVMSKAFFCLQTRRIRQITCPGYRTMHDT